MKYLFAILFLCFNLCLLGQPNSFSRVKIQLTPNQGIENLAEMGLDVDHGIYAKGRFFIGEFSATELERIQAAGFATETLVADLQAHLHEMNAHGSDEVNFRSGHCDEGGETIEYNYETPENFTLGNQAGFYTYEEMLAILDDMVAQYPHLISPRTPVGDILTHNNNPIYWLQISDNPNVEEADEPQVLYTALHHAREPNSLSQMIFYMWYLLERYDSDEEIKYLVDNTAMYFIPCVNPDGYIYNQSTNPDGGGFWRKNRRQNEDGSFGVDLNRNYGYEWGFDDAGSSPNPESSTYRGPEAFSEPETQAVRDFCEAHDFKIALNYHTFGNLLIYPWGFSDTPTEDAPIFNGFAEAMTRENDFLAGTGTQTVGYVVNGDSDDWMYGETNSKNTIYAMTPEVGPGDFGFWPPATAIETLCKSALLQNLTTAHLVHNFGAVEDLSGKFISEIENELSISVKRYGLADGGLTVSLTALSDNVANTGTPKTYNLEQNQIVEDMLHFTLSEDISIGEEVVLLLSIDNGIINISDTLQKLYLTTEVLVGDVSDDFETHWTPSTELSWNATTEDFYSSPSSITDSPNGNYPNNVISLVTMNASASIVEVDRAFLRFWAKWEIESRFDYAQLQLSVNDGESFFPICTDYTKTGSQWQDFEEPIYDGVQNEWIKEEVDITEYLILEEEPKIKIRFLMASDGFVEQDGFYFDDVEIVVNSSEVSTVIPIKKEDFIIYQARPNPAANYALIEIDAKEVSMQEAQLEVFNILGQAVLQKTLAETREQTIRLNTTNWTNGLYFYQIRWKDKVSSAKRLTITK